MSNRWAGPRVRWLIGAAAVVLAAAIVWALFVPFPDWIARHDVGAAKPALLQTARDAARGRLLTLAAGLFAAGALVFTALNFNLSRRTFELTEQGQVTDRFTKAIEQLGSDKLDVRIGGIYALERIARDSAKDHPTVIEVLTAFIREHSREQWPHTGQPVQGGSTRPDVQAAATVVGRRDAERDIRRIGIDLHGVDLTRADLIGAHLTGAVLVTAHLEGANLEGAHLEGANLTGAVLTDAVLTRADLTYAYLGDADLTRADLNAADLSHAHLASAVLNGAHLASAVLTGADLTVADLTDAVLPHAVLLAAHFNGAVLTRAVLTDANLRSADLSRARLDGAHLTGAHLEGAVLDGADLTGASWPVGVPVPDGWMVDSRSRRLKRASELSAAVPRGVVASARKSGAGCGAVACWGLGLVVVLGLPGLAVAGMMVRAARDAEPLWDKSPFISLALGPDPVGRFLLP